MARKSRKNSSQPESTAQIGQMSYVTAIYARLSVENSGKQDEGASLQNQIDVVRSMLQAVPISDLRRFTPITEKPARFLTVLPGTG